MTAKSLVGCNTVGLVSAMTHHCVEWDVQNLITRSLDVTKSCDSEKMFPSTVASPEFCSCRGAQARGARVPKFAVTKSSRSETHLADISLRPKLNKNYFLDSGDFGGLTAS